MPQAALPATLEIIPRLADIPAEEWDRLRAGARPLERKAESLPEGVDSASELVDSISQQDDANPFITYAFLASLENAGTVGGHTGWAPRHLVLRDREDRLIAAMPAYRKAHSLGEYVFDHGFAEAYARAGGAYYPKIQVSIPFTPATAPKFLLAPEADEAACRHALLGGLESLRDRSGASSVHATFLNQTDREAFLTAGYLERNDHQFHFSNPGYRDFEDFLADLASRKRKVLRRERREALSAGMSVEWVTGAALTEAHWDAFFAFYMETGSRKWGSPYLNRRFFSLVSERMAGQILLVMAKRNGRPVAGALNFIGGNTLYGRNWGAIEHHPFLHFELCYYQAIDFALAHGLARVEAGAQGEHKLARGYRPTRTVSAHRFADPGLHRAVAEYLGHERREVQHAEAELESMAPFRKAE